MCFLFEFRVAWLFVISCSRCLIWYFGVWLLLILFVTVWLLICCVLVGVCDLFLCLGECFDAVC